LLDVSKAIAEGDLSRRVTVVRNDEIGSIANSLNHVADSLQQLFLNLESSVEKRTHELYETNIQLKANRDQLSLILNSAAEGIYGIDSEGNCTFCNRSSLLLLGYEKEEDLLGKNMHDLTHHSYEDGSRFPLDSCKIFRAIQTGIGYTENGEVFWRKDGASFPVSYHAFPQVRNEQVIGAVITFTDITEHRQHEQQIEYMRCHDSLTGLFNRNCFDERHAEIDLPENLPLSIIFADINGLKLTNDIFGHSAGDELIKKSAEILKHACRESDMVARLGGDEFIIVLPNTTADETNSIIAQIRMEFSQTRVEAMRCSISLGSCTKVHQEQSLIDIIVNAENQMYQEKTRNRSTVNSAIIREMQETLHTRSPREKDHAEKVMDIASRFGSSLHLNEAEISALERTAYLHDIGKIVLDPHILDAKELSEDEREQMRQHPVIGYRILNLFDDTLDIAGYVYGHHERWDGSGYPRGLKQDQIPYISRILSIAEAYERIMERSHSTEVAIEEIRKGKGTQFDPELAHAFLVMIEQQ
jgi:diguanylate cyclase (GGDEF)-like protein/PAS domain S-box-containing protein